MVRGIAQEECGAQRECSAHAWLEFQEVIFFPILTSITSVMED